MLAFIRVVHLLKEAGIPGGPVLWLHDEIVLEVPIEFAEQARLLLDRAMTTAFAEVNAVRLGTYGGGAVKRRQCPDPIPTPVTGHWPRDSEALTSVASSGLDEVSE